MKKEVSKIYLIFNIVFLGLAIYIIMFPIISQALSSINPNITRCAFYEITGKYCPLCGGTRYIKGFFNNLGNISYLFSFFGFVVIFTICEFIFRVLNLILIRTSKYSKNTLSKIVIIDFIIHVLVFIIFIIYELIYIINTLH